MSTVLVASVIVTSDNVMIVAQVRIGFRRVHLMMISDVEGGFALIGRFSKCDRRSSASSSADMYRWSISLDIALWTMV